MNDAKQSIALLKSLVDTLDYKNAKIFYDILSARLKLLSIEKKQARAVKKQRRKAGCNYNVELSSLVLEDWSYLFGKYDNEEKTFCVYMHGDPKKALRYYKHFGIHSFLKPFYVGMGNKERPYNFLRGRVHSAKLKEMLDLGYLKEQIVCILADNLTEREARELESKMIVFFGIKLAGRMQGIGNHISGVLPCLLNNQYEPVPDEWSHFAAYTKEFDIK
jgi:hypothetical protein